MQAEFVAIVEEITGRGVRALISQVHLETGLAIELFLFAPQEPATAGPTSNNDGGGR